MGVECEDQEMTIAVRSCPSSRRPRLALDHPPLRNGTMMECSPGSACRPHPGDKGSHVILIIAGIARRKLRMLQDADRLEDLAAVPGNRLEALSGTRKGQYSIRINNQFRICFAWRDGAPESVEIVDYH